MKLNYCPNCGAKLGEERDLCNKCGFETARFGVNSSKAPENDFKNSLSKFIEGFIENNEDLLKDLAKEAEKGALNRGMFFSVEMRGDKPVIKSGEVKDIENLFRHTSIFPFLKDISEARDHGIEVKEVRSDVTESERGKRIKIVLPGIKSLTNISIGRIPGGLEILGRTDEKIYFSKVDLDGDYEVSDKKLFDNVLTIEVK